ncbi:MAG: LacI family DNA-binding transcriptional regulator [Oscillospiraceae bacterium]|nr:LacI family DNA-binding transcriptional regulator [Oscillospiraceae bacterium]MBR1458582.1 LacI family DNA-binding transcriptional regulator [Oscillospiraceae bacterium]MBR1897725.1 LacI family DNA-binding transcriptional regulator [Oscillospiraceae bacterium]
MAKSVRMADIAQRLGVSVVTVSKALRGKDGVSDALREQIVRTANELGYSAKPSAEAISAGSYTIGILTPGRYLERGSSFYWSLYERLLTHISAQGDFCLLEVVTDEEESTPSLPRLLQENKVDGLIIMGGFADQYLRMLFAQQRPVVMLDAYQAWFPCDTVISDGYYGMYTMTSYLISRGHRRLKYVGTVGETSSITDRYLGFCRALMEAGLPITAGSSIPDRVSGSIVDTHLPSDIALTTDALVCNCDITAYDVCTKLDAIGVRVPEDISVIGFDNYILSEMSATKITTYEVDQNAMAKASARQIRRRIGDPRAERKLQIISGRMILRESVAAR